MRFSFVIFGVPPAHSTPLVRRAEQLGFDAVWFGDHVVTPLGTKSHYPYSPSGDAGYTADTPLNDVWIAIAHAAAATRTIHLGPSVLILPLRHPAAVAQAAATAQAMSGGRLRHGLGAGWLREEFVALGIPFETRGRRMDESLEIMRRLWVGDDSGFVGEFFSLPPVSLGLTPSPPVPVTIGGSSAPALRRAARWDGWNGPEVPLVVAVRRRDAMLALRAADGRGADRFRCYVKPASIEPAVLRSYRDAGFEDLVVPFRALHGNAAQSLDERLVALDRVAESILLPDLVADRCHPSSPMRSSTRSPFLSRETEA